MASISSTVTDRNKEQEVNDWLGKVFGEEAIPRYEVSSRSIEILHQLKLLNEKQDAYAQLITQDYTQKAEEYATETKRLNRVLQRVGLGTSSLSQSGLVSLRSLASVALLLDLKDTSDSSFLVAQSKMYKERQMVGEMRRQELQAYSQLLDKTKTALVSSNSLKQALHALEEEEAEQTPHIQKKAKQAGFLQIKAREYRQQVEQLQEKLKGTGVDPSLYHQSLLEKEQELKQIQEQLVPLKVKLDSYQALPPDMALAKVKLEESKRELMKLESEVMKSFDSMYLQH